ncbi:hypothetical protein KKD88_01525 [Patescibacteria group bacterium]|nr:hypothetical protein [Patescibacteria group bacterium]MBU1629736.1 hypothetical protein [Patescibacteria group bacterium]
MIEKMPQPSAQPPKREPLLKLLKDLPRAPEGPTADVLSKEKLAEKEIQEEMFGTARTQRRQPLVPPETLASAMPEFADSAVREKPKDDTPIAPHTEISAFGLQPTPASRRYSKLEQEPGAAGLTIKTKGLQPTPEAAGYESVKVKKFDQIPQAEEMPEKKPKAA